MVTRQLQIKRRTAKVRRSENDVLPLCHATKTEVASILRHKNPSLIVQCPQISVTRMHFSFCETEILLSSTLSDMTSRSRDRIRLIILLDLFLVHFSLIFLFVACGGLSWLHVSFLLHVKYAVLHCIATSCRFACGCSGHGRGHNSTEVLCAQNYFLSLLLSQYYSYFVLSSPMTTFLLSSSST